MRTPGRSARTVSVTGCCACVIGPSGATQSIARAATMMRVSRNMDVPLLQMAGISKRFPGVVALDDVAFDVAQGEVVALVGENGAGKSTLMKILAELHRPDHGTIRLEGRE